MFPIYGILATESVDRTGERLLLDGADISDLKYINDEHQSEHCFDFLGSIKESKKIYKEQDCADERQLFCWRRVLKPFIYIRGALASPEHPNAAAAEGLIRYSAQNPEFPVGLSVEGATIERSGRDLVQTKIIAASLTVKPCNTECLVFPEISLTKSFVELPSRYRNSKGASKHFYNMPSDTQRLLAKSQMMKEVVYLMKSEQPLSTASIIKCWNCGEGKIFMMNRPPNRCVACGEAFHLYDIYKARNSQGEL